MISKWPGLVTFGLARERKEGTGNKQFFKEAELQPAWQSIERVKHVGDEQSGCKIDCHRGIHAACAVLVQDIVAISDYQENSTS